MKFMRMFFVLFCQLHQVLNVPDEYCRLPGCRAYEVIRTFGTCCSRIGQVTDAPRLGELKVNCSFPLSAPCFRLRFKTGCLRFEIVRPCCLFVWHAVNMNSLHKCYCYMRDTLNHPSDDHFRSCTFDRTHVNDDNDTSFPAMAPCSGPLCLQFGVIRCYVPIAWGEMTDVYCGLTFQAGGFDSM